MRDVASATVGPHRADKAKPDHAARPREEYRNSCPTSAMLVGRLGLGRDLAFNAVRAALDFMTRVARLAGLGDTRHAWSRGGRNSRGDREAEPGCAASTGKTGVPLISPTGAHRELRTASDGEIGPGKRSRRAFRLEPDAKMVNLGDRFLPGARMRSGRAPAGGAGVWRNRNTLLRCSK